MPPAPAGLDLSRPFTRPAALAAGLTDADLGGPEYVRVLRGVYRHRSCPDSDQARISAALLVHPPPTAYASHLSAARLYGLPLPDLAGVHITVAHADDRRRRDLARHHLARPHDEVWVVRGLRVSAPEQLFCELAELLTLVDLVVAGDALVRWHGTTPERLLRAARRAPKRVSRLAVRGAGLVRAEVDSPMETRVRMLLVLAGLCEPVVNFVVRWQDGQVRFRFDLCYPELRLVIEYDGQQHRSDLDQWDTDIARREWMDTEGWTLIVVVARASTAGPTRPSTAALLRCGGELPQRPSDEWRAHFPVR